MKARQPSRSSASRSHRTISRLRAIALVCVALAAASCSRGAARVFEGETITVACASCVFEMEGVGGCPWAAEIDGEHYLMQGNLPEDHNSHMPDGICMMARQAVIDGKLEDGRLTIAKMELLPAQHIPQPGDPDHHAHDH